VQHPRLELVARRHGLRLDEIQQVVAERGAGEGVPGAGVAAEDAARQWEEEVDVSGLEGRGRVEAQGDLLRRAGLVIEVLVGRHLAPATGVVGLDADTLDLERWVGDVDGLTVEILIQQDAAQGGEDVVGQDGVTHAVDLIGYGELVAAVAFETAQERGHGEGFGRHGAVWSRPASSGLA